MAKYQFPIAVALDDDWKQSKVWLKRLKGLVWGFKVGSILFCEKGPKVVEEVLKAGHRVFLDLKYCDIPNTVAHSVENAFDLGVDVLTVHAFGGRAMLEACARKQTKDQKIVAVTVLTSLEEADLREVGVGRSLSAQVEALGDLAISSGIAGLVCSPLEVSQLRARFPSSFLVTPGVRIAETHDQKRVATLESALKSGSSLVVLGRALTESKDWESAWAQITSFSEETSLRKRSARR